MDLQNPHCTFWQSCVVYCGKISMCYGEMCWISHENAVVYYGR